MRTLSDKVSNAIEQAIKNVEIATGSLVWKHTEDKDDVDISILASDLTDEQDESLTAVQSWGEMLITDDVTLSPWSDDHFVSFDITIDRDELQQNDIDDVISTLKKKYPCVK